MLNIVLLQINLGEIGVADGSSRGRVDAAQLKVGPDVVDLGDDGCVELGVLNRVKAGLGVAGQSLVLAVVLAVVAFDLALQVGHQSHDVVVGHGQAVAVGHGGQGRLVVADPEEAVLVSSSNA